MYTLKVVIHDVGDSFTFEIVGDPSPGLSDDARDMGAWLTIFTNYAIENPNDVLVEALSKKALKWAVKRQKEIDYNVKPNYFS